MEISPNSFYSFYSIRHNATSINIGIYLFCFYLLLLGFRLILETKNVIKFLGLIFLLCSFSIKSNVLLVWGLVLIFYFKQFLKTKKVKIIDISLIFLTSISFVIVYLNYFKPYGIFENYNSINIKNLSFDKLIYNLQNFFFLH